MQFSGVDYSNIPVEKLLEMHNESRLAFDVHDVCDIAAELHKRLEAALEQLETIKNKE